LTSLRRPDAANTLLAWCLAITTAIAFAAGFRLHAGTWADALAALGLRIARE
jgi:hypothetical protein